MKHTEKENNLLAESERKAIDKRNRQRRANRRIQNRLWIMLGVIILVLLLAYWFFFITLEES